MDGNTNASMLKFKLEHISQIFNKILISSWRWKWNIVEIFKIPNEIESSFATDIRVLHFNSIRMESLNARKVLWKPCKYFIHVAFRIPYSMKPMQVNASNMRENSLVLFMKLDIFDINWNNGQLNWTKQRSPVLKRNCCFRISTYYKASQTNFQLLISYPSV